MVIHILDYCLTNVKRILYSHAKKKKEVFYTIYTNICALCSRKGISIAKLERETGLGNATIRGWANSSPTVDRLKAVADYFGVTVDDLLSDNNATKT